MHIKSNTWWRWIKHLWITHIEPTWSECIHANSSCLQMSFLNMYHCLLLKDDWLHMSQYATVSVGKTSSTSSSKCLEESTLPFDVWFFWIQPFSWCFVCSSGFWPSSMKHWPSQGQNIPCCWMLMWSLNCNTSVM